ncbi:MAG: NUDIX hydrolase [Sulfurimonas sp.]
MAWKPKTPYLTTDGIVELFDNSDTLLGIVLIQRKNPPYGLAFPGGFVDVGECVEEAVVREMKEEISLDVEIKKLLGVYSDPNRDPRFHTASVVYICKAYGEPKAADDAKELTVIPIEQLRSKQSELVFDHGKILADYLNG